MALKIGRHVVVNGFGASGKTVLMPILDAFQTTLLSTYCYELEWLFQLSQQSIIPQAALMPLVPMHLRHLRYNHLHGRLINTKFGDLSSVFRSHKLWQYLYRASQSGDRDIGYLLASDSLASCYVMSQSYTGYPILDSLLMTNLLWIEFIRDPLFRFKQLFLCYEQTVRQRYKDFTFRKSVDSSQSLYPFYYEPIHTNFHRDSIATADVVLNILSFEQDVIESEIFGWSSFGNYLLIPFETFVTSPFQFMNCISNFLSESSNTRAVRTSLRRQRIPRERITHAPMESVYKRCGLKKFISQSIEDERYLYSKHLVSSFNLTSFQIDWLEVLSSRYNEFLTKALGHSNLSS